VAVESGEAMRESCLSGHVTSLRYKSRHRRGKRRVGVDHRVRHDHD
jgi:hypothetical protein